MTTVSGPSNTTNTQKTTKTTEEAKATAVRQRLGKAATGRTVGADAAGKATARDRLVAADPARALADITGRADTSLRAPLGTSQPAATPLGSAQLPKRGLGTMPSALNGDGKPTALMKGIEGGGGAQPPTSPIAEPAETIRTSNDKDTRREATVEAVEDLERRLAEAPADERAAILESAQGDLAAIGQGIPELRSGDTDRVLASLSRSAELLGPEGAKALADTVARGFPEGLARDQGYDLRNAAELGDAVQKAVEGGHGATFGAALSQALTRQGVTYNSAGADADLGLAVEMGTRRGIETVTRDYQEAQGKVAEVNRRIGLVESAVGGALTPEQTAAGREAIRAENEGAFRDLDAQGQRMASVLDGAGILAAGDGVGKQAGLDALAASARTPPAEAVARKLADFAAQETTTPGSTPLAQIGQLPADQREALAQTTAMSVVAGGRDAASVLSKLGALEGGHFGRATSVAHQALTLLDGEASMNDVLAAAGLGLNAAETGVVRNLGLGLGDDVARSFAKRLGVAGGVFDIFSGASAIASGGDRVKGAIDVVAGIGTIAAVAAGSAGIGLAVTAGALALKLGVDVWRQAAHRADVFEDISKYAAATGRYTEQEGLALGHYLMDLSSPAERARLLPNLEAVAGEISQRTGRTVTGQELLDAMIKGGDLSGSPPRTLLATADDGFGETSNDWASTATRQWHTGVFDKYGEDFATFSASRFADYLMESGTLDGWLSSGLVS